jgi:hypothetical protein
MNNLFVHHRCAFEFLIQLDAISVKHCQIKGSKVCIKAVNAINMIRLEITTIKFIKLSKDYFS